MERTPSACAVQWSIDLENGLRSKKPGKSAEAILDIGPRLEWWSRVSTLHAAEYRMFGLIPGENKLFANTILLRLADAFKSGDKNMKSCIARIFFLDLKQRRRLGKKDVGILSKDKLDNYRELLTRIKIVFDTGDVEERALTLVLFGCWVHIAKDSADIRYLILVSLVSPHIPEAKASLFAAGCFSEVADDFAYVFLEMLVGLLMSSETSRPIRLAGAHAFAKMWCSILLADSAHKAGVKLILESSDEDFSLVMLVSLSKIVSKWTSLIPRQMELLFSFMTNDRGLSLQAMALKCLLFILAKRMCHLPAGANVTLKLFGVINQSDFPPALHFEALRALCKILSSSLDAIAGTEILTIFSKFLQIVEFKTQSPIISQRLLAVRVLANILDNLSAILKNTVGGIGSSVASLVITFITDRVSKLIMLVPDKPHVKKEAEQEVKGLLLILIDLVEKRLDLCHIILDKICIVIEHMTSSALENHHRTEHYPRFLLYLSKVLITCVEKLDFSADGAKQVFKRIEHVVDHVGQCRLFPIYIHLIYQFMWPKIGEDEHEIYVIDSMKEILVKKDYWLSYKLGKYSVSRGAWFLAAYIFEKLIPMVRSDICCFWLKSLSGLSELERRVQLLRLALSRKGESIAVSHIENVVWASDRLCSLEEEVEVLGASVSAPAFSFQRWFITLRSKVVGTVADVLKLLSTSESSRELGYLLQLLAHASSRFTRLAKEFDLLVTSSIGMDRESMRIISDLGLSCSLLAFSTGLTIRFAGKKSCIIYGLESSEEQFQSQLVHDLLKRLGCVDLETSKKLSQLFDFRKELQKEISATSLEARNVAELCKYSIERFLGLVACNVGENGGITQIPRDALQLLFDIIFAWIRIPFRTPKYFFKLRPPVTAELFIANEDGKATDNICVSSGFQLPLNLCIQLRNISADQLCQVSKLYCILHPQTCFTNRDKKEAWKSEHTIDLNDKLLHFTTTGSTKGNPRDKFVVFDLNKGGQGFATCLLDVCDFPAGLYQIKWHSCYIDNDGAYWSLMPLNTHHFFTVQESSKSGSSVRVS